MSRDQLVPTAVPALRDRDLQTLSLNSPVVTMDPSKEFIHLCLKPGHLIKQGLELGVY